MSLFNLTLKSILNRKLTTSLLVISIALSTMLLIGVQKVKISAKKSFSTSISGTDLIVGARSGDVQLLMYTVFRQGHPVANISWQSVKDIEKFSEVDWLVPISLGDSHKGYPVIGTTIDYFQHYRYANKRQLKLSKGRLFQTPFEVVLGAEVAEKLGYDLDDQLYLSHGIAKSNLPVHKNRAFKVVGILETTRTPVDKSAHISLEGITAIHLNPKEIKDNKSLLNIDLTPKAVTSCIVGLKSKFTIFTVQRRITNWDSEPLMAVIPGVALSRLWNSIGTIDSAFFIITILVIIIAFIGLLLALLISLNQRKRELAILRTMGAQPFQLSQILIIESLLITVSGVAFGLVLIIGIGNIIKPILEEKMGLILSFNSFTLAELYFALGIILFGVIISIIPAIMAYRRGLSEGFISL